VHDQVNDPEADVVGLAKAIVAQQEGGGVPSELIRYRVISII
jgi:hypothetical protein